MQKLKITKPQKRFMSLKEKQLKSSKTIINFLDLIMVHIEKNIGKKFQACIFCRSQEKMSYKVKAAKNAAQNQS